MQYIYVLDYSTPSRVTIKVADNVNVSENIDDILEANGWLIINLLMIK